MRTAYDHDGDRVLVECNQWVGPVACYAYGPFGPIARTSLETATPCVRYLLSDGRRNIPAHRGVVAENHSTT